MNPPDKQTRRRRRWLVVLGLALALPLYWWWSRPAELRLVSRVPVKLSASIAGESHFISDMQLSPYGPLFAHGGAIEAYHWDGTIRWRFYPKAIKPANGSSFAKRKPYSWRDLSISPNDRYQAAIVSYDRNHEYLAAWTQGHLSASVPLPTSRQSSTVQALDSGRALCFIPMAKAAKMLCVENGGVVAQGSLPTPSGKSFCSGKFSPDGQATLSHNCHAVTTLVHLFLTKQPGRLTGSRISISMEELGQSTQLGPLRRIIYNTSTPSSASPGNVQVR